MFLKNKNIISKIRRSKARINGSSYCIRVFYLTPHLFNMEAYIINPDQTVPKGSHLVLGQKFAYQHLYTKADMSILTRHDE